MPHHLRAGFVALALGSWKDQLVGGCPEQGWKTRCPPTGWEPRPAYRRLLQRQPPRSPVGGPGRAVCQPYIFPFPWLKTEAAVSLDGISEAVSSPLPPHLIPLQVLRPQGVWAHSSQAGPLSTPRTYCFLQAHGPPVWGALGWTGVLSLPWPPGL